MKAAAAIQYAEILVGAGVHTIDDVSALLSDPQRLTEVEQQLRMVPGNGQSDVRLNYLWMLVGDNHHVKPDRMVLGWLNKQLEQTTTPEDARRFLIELAQQLGWTPWELDHAIWRKQSGRDS